MDVARLGFEIDSSQADKGTVSLTKLTGAAQRAEAAAAGLAGAGKATSAANAAVSSSASGAATALNREAASATKAATALVAANSNARRMGGSMSGLAAQVQDIGVTAAMGMNPLQIALQQGTQIAGQMEMALQGGASASAVFGAALRSLISPVSIISIGLTALLAAGLQMVDWPALAAWGLNTLASALDAVGPYAIAAAAGIALLYAPAILSGIAMLSEAILGVTARLAGMAIGFALANPGTAFVLGLVAAVAAANIFRDELTQIFGVDIVGAVKGGINTVISVVVGGYNGIVAAWDKLPAAFEDIAKRAGYLFADQLRYWINEAIIKVQGFIKMVNGAFGSNIGLPSTLGPLAPPKTSGGASDVSAIIADEIAKAKKTDWVGEIGSGISNLTSGAADKLRSIASGFGSVEEAAKKAGKAGKAAGDKIKAGAKKAADQMSEAAQVAKGFLSTFRQDLMQGKSLWQAFGDAALNVLNKIADKAETAFVNALFPSGGGGLLSGGSGFFGSLLGGIGKLFGFASGGYTGGGAASGVAGVVHGGEYVFSKRATDRIGVSALEQLHRQAKGYASGGYVAPVTPRMQSPANESRVHVTVGVSADNNGNLMPFVESVSERKAGQVSSAAIGKYDANLAGRVGEVMERHG